MENKVLTQADVERAAQYVFDVMCPRIGADDMIRLKDAFHMAYEAHRLQYRASGEPYIIHPIEVARIAAEELELDVNPVIATFLHDVVEDTDCTIEQIREKFGDDVAFLVDVVTKRQKAKYENTKQVDNYKQILDSVNYDVRALLVKLSDRLHNMRTLASLRPDKQMKIAGETDFFYAPLAGRLGLYHVKSDLENLSFRYRCPREFEMLERLLEEDRIRTKKDLDEFNAKIKSLLDGKKISARIQVRYRKPYSIWRNMHEEGCDFAHVDFKHYIRVIYTTKEPWSEKDTSLFIYSILSDAFKERPGSVINYIDNPKDNGYQSLHVKFLNHAGVWEELHISSERMVRNSQLGCVVERGESWLERFRGVLKDIADSNDGLYFMEGVSSSLYNEDIIAFTPNGKGIILPKGATALDFAFEVHSSIGEHAQYARINGRLSPLKTQLKRGDCVEIGVSETVEPRKEWLDYANTYRAKRCLRDLLKHQTQPKYNRCSICNPLPGDEVIGFKESDGTIIVHTRQCPDAIRKASEHGDSIVSVLFEENSDLLYPVCIQITAIDRYHLLRDIIDCFTEEFHLSISNLDINTDEQIVVCKIQVSVHSATELHLMMQNISQIKSIDEVKRVDL